MANAARIDARTIATGLTIAKDLLLVVVIAAVGWRYVPMFFDSSLTEGFEVSEINLLVVKLRPQASEKALRAPGRSQGDDATPGDGDAADGALATWIAPNAHVGEQAQRVVLQEERIRKGAGAAPPGPAQAGWSYVGTWRDDTWSDLLFRLDPDTTPDSLRGQQIRATTDVFIRADPPRFVLGWTKGDPVGVIKAGVTAAVSEVRTIPAKGGGQRVWVRI